MWYPFYKWHMNQSSYHLTTAWQESIVLSHLNSKLWKVPDKFFLLPTGHCLLWVRQSGRCVMMLGQSQHSSDSQQSPGSHSQGSNAMKQHNSTRLSETYFYLCILPLLQRMHSSIFSIDPFISDNKNWVFCAKKSNRVYSLWFCVCSILARVSIQLSEFENCEWEYCEEWRNGCSSWLTLTLRPGQWMLWMWHAQWKYILHITGQQQQGEHGLWGGVEPGDTISPWQKFPLYSSS